MRTHLLSTTVSALLLAGCAAGGPSGSRPAPGTISTTSGAVRGAVDREVRSFANVPYAQPPVGELRWAPPRPAARSARTLDGTGTGVACPQQASSVADVDSTDEDCLRLNVTTPARAGRDRPVMVWLHGGGGTNGSGGVFDPRRLVRENGVVVVTVNYRLGVLGNLGLPGLDGGGTFGLQDQQAALRWVRDNARAFGGDPGNVTLFGESYGALSTTAQLVSPAARGLFHRAVLQSDLALHDYPAGTIAPGAPALPSIWASPEELEATGTVALQQLGCADVACLREQPVEKLLPLGQLFTRFGYGNDVLPEDPRAALRAGRFQRVPVIAGGTRDEHRLYTAAFYEAAGQPVTEDVYQGLLREAFGERAPAVAAQYPSAAYGSPALAWSAVVTDRVWARALDEQTRLLARHTPVYAYEFADRDAPGVIPFPAGFPPGAHHSSEVFYQFDVTGTGEFEGAETPFSASQKRLASTMNRYWSTFARTGDPGSGWPRYRDGRVLSLAPDRITRTDYPTTHDLPFWDEVQARSAASSS